METRRSALRTLVYGTFYRLPHPVRRRLVRLIVPKYIVGAVTLVRDAEAPPPGRLLLLRQPPGRGWGLPAGLLRRGEPPVVGAARELAEESGVRLDPHTLTPAVPNAVVHAKGWVDVVFEASVPASTTPLVVDGAEVYEAAFHPLDDLPRLTTATARLLAYYGIGPLAPAAAGPAGPAADAGPPASDTGPHAGPPANNPGPDAGLPANNRRADAGPPANNPGADASPPANNPGADASPPANTGADAGAEGVAATSPEPTAGGEVARGG